LQLGLITSAWIGTELEGRRGIELARRIGFDSIDLFWDPLSTDADGYRALLDDVRAVGLPVLSVVCTALGLNDFNPAVARFHVERAKRHVDLAHDVGARNVLFCPGEYLFGQGLLPPAHDWNAVVAATREVGDYAAERALDLAVEMLPFPHAIVKDVDTMIALLDGVGRDNVGACVDCSHLWLSRIDPAEIARLAGRIAHVHVSDCDGERHGDLPPGRGNTPLLEILRRLREVGYDGGVSVELEFSPDPSAMVGWVEESYAETARLVAAAGMERLP
jgi:D-psicose/D-tagatose/L-ribulose 3-epimerase